MVVFWLGFLPNAPYLITDFIHLDVVGPDSLLWYDGMMIFMYSLAGVSAWVLSLDMVMKKKQASVSQINAQAKSSQSVLQLQGITKTFPDQPHPLPLHFIANSTI